PALFFASSSPLRPHSCSSSASTKRVDLPLHVRLELSEVVEVLFGRLGRDLLTALEARARERQRLSPHPRQLAALRLRCHLRRIGECRLRDAVRRYTEEKGGLRRLPQGVGKA